MARDHALAVLRLLFLSSPIHTCGIRTPMANEKPITKTFGSSFKLIQEEKKSKIITGSSFQELSFGVIVDTFPSRRKDERMTFIISPRSNQHAVSLNGLFHFPV